MAQVMPAASLALPKMTFEEFLAWAMKEETHAEWVDGEVELKEMVSREHQDVCGFLFRLISEFVEAYALGTVFTLEFLMRLRTRPAGREPDILFVASEHQARIQPNFLDGPADLVVEIVSPESQERDREIKRVEYERAGVSEYWLIDLVTRAAVFYRLQTDGSYQAVALEEGIYRSAVLDGLWLDTAWLWQRPLPTMAQVRQRLGLP
jgi:Uma2 family endonuclease